MFSLTCAECSNKSLTWEPFWDLSLPITGAGSVIECMNEYQKTEQLSDENSPFCSKCNEKRKMTKKLEISRCPNILILHLKRFGKGGKKNHNLIMFPIEQLKIKTESYKLQGQFLHTFSLYKSSDILTPKF